MPDLPKDTPVVINSQKRFHQKNNYTGLRWKGKLMPTDIDGFMEFNNRLFIFIESKCEGAMLPYGQKLALERVTDAVELSGKPSYCLVANHNTPVDQDIELAKSIVTRVRTKGEWHDVEGQKTVREVMDLLIGKHVPEYLD